MQPKTMPCDNCGKPALILQTHYEYRPKRGAQQDQPQQELVETRYEIDCPNCGKRTLVQKAK